MSSQMLAPRPAAAYLGIALGTYEDLCRRGEIPAFFLTEGKIRRVLVEDLDAYIASRRATATGKAHGSDKAVA